MNMILGLGWVAACVAFPPLFLITVAGLWLHHMLTPKHRRDKFPLSPRGGRTRYGYH
jgi:hypothetical protein